MATDHPTWPSTVDGLLQEQERLARTADAVPPWHLPAPPGAVLIGGCFVAYARGEAGPGGPGDRAWAAAVAWRPGSGRTRRPGRVPAGAGPSGPRQAADVESQAVVPGTTGDRYRPGLLALREGPLLEAAVRALAARPDVLLVDATGRDHPRRAGLAVHLGAVLQIPTVGVTHRPLYGAGEWPELRRGAVSPVLAGGEVVGYWVCTRSGARPVIAHAGWRTGPEAAAEVVILCSGEGARTPAPLGEARRVARETRAVVEGRVAR